MSTGYIAYLSVSNTVEICKNAEIVYGRTKLRNIPIGQVCAIRLYDMNGDEKQSYVMVTKQNVDEKGRMPTVDINSGTELYYDPDTEVEQCPNIELCPYGQS